MTCFYQLANLFRREFSRTIINAGTKIGDEKYVEGIAATFRRNLLLIQSVNELSQRKQRSQRMSVKLSKNRKKIKIKKGIKRITGATIFGLKRTYSLGNRQSFYQKRDQPLSLGDRIVLFIRCDRTLIQYLVQVKVKGWPSTQREELPPYHRCVYSNTMSFLIAVFSALEDACIANRTRLH